MYIFVGTSLPKDFLVSLVFMVVHTEKVTWKKFVILIKIQNFFNSVIHPLEPLKAGIKRRRGNESLK